MNADPVLDPEQLREMIAAATAMLETTRGVLAQREEEARDLIRGPRQDVETWERRVEALVAVERAFALTPDDLESDDEANTAEPSPRDGGRDGRSNSLLDQAVAIVNAQRGVIDGGEVLAKLASGGVVDRSSRDQVKVRNALYYAANTAKTILKVGRNLYAPLDYAGQADDDNLIFHSTAGESE